MSCNCMMMHFPQKVIPLVRLLASYCNTKKTSSARKKNILSVWSFITDSCMLFLSLIDQIQLNIPHPRRWRYNVKSRIAKETYICVNWVPFSMGGSGVDYVSHQFPPAYWFDAQCTPIWVPARAYWSGVSPFDTLLILAYYGIPITVHHTSHSAPLNLITYSQEDILFFLFCPFVFLHWNIYHIDLN